MATTEQTEVCCSQSLRCASSRLSKASPPGTSDTRLEYDHDPKSEGSTRACPNQTCALKDREGRLEGVPQKETLKLGSLSGQRRSALCPPKVLMTSRVSSQQLSGPWGAGTDPSLQWRPLEKGWLAPGLEKRLRSVQDRRKSGQDQGPARQDPLHPAFIRLSSPPSAKWPRFLPLHLRHAP